MKISSQNYFQAHYIFKIDQFYKLHMRKYLFDKYGIDYAFDTLIGDNYFDMAELAVIDDKTIQLKGSYISLTKIIAKLDSCNVKYKILDIKHKKRDESFMHDGVIDYSEFRQKGYPSFVSMFYNTGLAPSFNTDESEYRMILHDES